MPRGIYPRQSVWDRFWSKVDICEWDKCWMWVSSATPGGYGRFRLNDKRKDAHAHRIAWILTRGDIPAGLCILHRCDNPKCVNPNHLFLGTVRDNNKDMAKKGRVSRGETHPFAKLTEHMAREIKQSKDSTSTLTKKFGIGAGIIQRIRRGEAWSHVKVG